MTYKKKSKTIQVRVSETDRHRIDMLYQRLDDFNLSSFVRKSIKELCEKNDLQLDGIGNFTIH